MELRQTKHWSNSCNLPEEAYEISGQVNRVVFVEGLSLFKGGWFLYYATADSKIAVAKGSNQGSSQLTPIE